MGTQLPLPKGAQPPPIFGPYLLRPNGCMDQDATWYGARPRPMRLCFIWGPSPPKFSVHVYYSWWLGSLVAKTLDLQLAGCQFNSRPRRCRVTTLGKLFTPTCLNRSQWFSDGMIGCDVRGRGQLCLSRQPLRCTDLGTGCAPFL